MTPDDNPFGAESEFTRRTLLRQASVGAGATVIGIGALSGSAAATVCARTIGYWKTHPEAWPRGEDIALPADAPCGRDPCILLTSDRENTTSYEQAMEILNTQPRGDKTIIMAQQLIAALLNMRSGALGECITGPGSAVAAARAFLGEYAAVTDGELTEQSTSWHGYEWAKDELDAYNNGYRCACKSE